MTGPSRRALLAGSVAAAATSVRPAFAQQAAMPSPRMVAANTINLAGGGRRP